MRKFSLKKADRSRMSFGSFQTLGTFLGYPQCCIESFSKLEHLYKHIPNRPLKGTGFVPCEQCTLTKTEEQLIAEISVNRIHNKPFPQEGKYLLRAEMRWLMKAVNNPEKYPQLSSSIITWIQNELLVNRYDLAHRKRERQERLDNRRSLPVEALVRLSRVRKSWGGLDEKYHVIGIPFEFWDSIEIHPSPTSWRKGKHKMVVTHDWGVYMTTEWFVKNSDNFIIPTNGMPMQIRHQSIEIGVHNFSSFNTIDSGKRLIGIDSALTKAFNQAIMEQIEIKLGELFHPVTEFNTPVIDISDIPKRGL